MNRDRNRILMAVFLAAGALASADDLRVAVKSVATVDSRDPDGTVVLLAYGEAVAVALADPSPFVQGVEIEVRLPKALTGSEGTFGWTLYRGVRPAPSSTQFDYEAEPLLTQPFPARVSVVYQVPVAERHALRSGPYATVIPSLCPPASFPLLFRVSSFGKGVSKAMESAQFRVSVRPILTDEGSLRVTVRFPEGFERSKYVAFVDERRFDALPEQLYLRKGQHQVRVEAENFRDEVRLVVVEAGRFASLELEMQPDRPMAVFEAPANAHVTLDGQPVDLQGPDALPLEPGEHTVVCKLGDYVITRKFQALRGKSYRLVLAVELKVLETP